MKINPATFSVIIQANKYQAFDPNVTYEGVIDDKVEKIELELTLDKFMASNFLFKFTPDAFKITIDDTEYKVLLKSDNTGVLNTIALYDTDGNIYVVTNYVGLLSEIHEGYFRLIANDKFNSVLELNSWDMEDDTNENDNEIIDEFDETK